MSATFWALNGGKASDVIKTSISGGGQLVALTYGNGKFVVSGEISGISGITFIRTSTDGVTWVAPSLTDGTTQVWDSFAYAAAYGNSAFCIVGSSSAGGGSLYSVNGDNNANTFSLYDIDADLPGGGIDVCYGNSVFLSVGYGKVSTSSSGANNNWAANTSVGTGLWRGCCYNGSSLYVIVGYTGSICTSANATTWTSRTSGTTEILYSVDYSSSLGLYCAVGANGTILTSPDGTTWTARTSGITELLRKVKWSSDYGKFFAVGGGSNGKLLYSTDGITWTICPYVFAGTPLFNVIAGPTTVVCATNSGVVYKSDLGFV